jgi:hypothetical protein
LTYETGSRIELSEKHEASPNGYEVTLLLKLGSGIRKLACIHFAYTRYDIPLSSVVTIFGVNSKQSSNIGDIRYKVKSLAVNRSLI